MANIVFLHGLESGPGGHKATRLRTVHQVTAPQLPTKRSQEWLAVKRAQLPPDVAAEPLAVAAKAVAEARPDVVVGSSFGGAMAAALLEWQGPLVLLAPAAEKLLGITALPKRRGRVVIVHGRRDEMVPCADSVRLASASACDLALWLVDDDHRLKASVDAGLMDEAIAWACKTYPGESATEAG